MSMRPGPALFISSRLSIASLFLRGDAPHAWGARRYRPSRPYYELAYCDVERLAQMPLVLRVGTSFRPTPEYLSPPQWMDHLDIRASTTSEPRVFSRAFTPFLGSLDRPLMMPSFQASPRSQASPQASANSSPCRVSTRASNSKAACNRSLSAFTRPSVSVSLREDTISLWTAYLSGMGNLPQIARRAFAE
ncbi:hypothetical protein AF71_00005650 [Rhizobium sp. 57MFTsu3.2]|nr:hypothetical protein [Rhizobium sp. 57MFTsu3.2]